MMGDLLRLNAVNGNAGNGPAILFTNNGDVLNLARIGAVDAGNWGGALVFQTAPQTGASPGGTPVERVRIDSSGNVGIGTTAPASRLEVYAGSLGSTAGSTIKLLTLHNANANQNYLDVLQVRNAAGSNWDTTTTRIQQVTDASNQAYIDFNPAGGTWGMAFGSGSYEYIRIRNGGNVGIGTTNPTQKLSVNGTIRAKEVIVDTGWSDYVFAPDYRLAPLSEVEQHIKADGHLPGIPSATDVAAHGVTIGEMQAKLLAKIEELTLHQIEQEKAIHALKTENAELQRRLDAAGISR
jgi:hypothetical protein